MKKSLILNLKISILAGILFPFVLGVKELTLIPICFSSVWFIYVVLLLIPTFLIKPNLRIRLRRQEGAIMVRYELQDSKRNEKSA